MGDQRAEDYYNRDRRHHQARVTTINCCFKPRTRMALIDHLDRLGSALKWQAFVCMLAKLNRRLDGFVAKTSTPRLQA
jgi:hypothetical protein